MSNPQLRSALLIFDEACELTGDERATFLDEACGGNRELRAEVESMLAWDEAADEREAPPPVRAALLDLAREAASVPMPETIGGYGIVRLIARGGMGVVYEARQENPLRQVAIKVSRTGTASSEHMRRFQLEAQLLARLRHPGIAEIFEAGTRGPQEGAAPYLVMELVEGPPLTDYAAAHLTSPREKLELMVRICDAVGHAHEKGVIHRDLKPDNVLIEKGGSPKVLDFGVAKVEDAGGFGAATLRTEAGRVVGTLGYMAPEQLAGRTEGLSPAADVYSLGVMTYELLTDRLPHELDAATLSRTLAVVTTTDAPLLGTIRPEYRGDIEAVVAKALEKEVRDRYPDARALQSDIERYLGDKPVQARSQSAFYRLRKLARRNKVAVGTLALLFVVLLAGVALSVGFGLRQARQREAADRRAYRASVAAAFRELRDDNIAAAQQLLEEAPSHLRNWEWYYLREQMEPAPHSSHVFAGIDEEFAHVGFLKGTNQVFGIDGESVAHIRDRATGKETVVRLRNAAQQRTPRAVSPDGSLVLSTCRSRHPDGGWGDSEHVLWETTTGKTIHRILDREPASDVVIAPGGTHIAFCKPSQKWLRVHLYDVGTSTFLLERTVNRGAVLRFSSDGDWLVFSLPKNILFRGVADSREVRPRIDTGTPQKLLALSPDRAYVAAATSSRVSVWDVRTGQLVLSKLCLRTRQLSFTPDGTALVVLGDSLRFLDPRSGRLLRTVRYSGSSSGLSHGWDGPLLATADTKGKAAAIHVWDTGAESPLVLRGHDSYVYPVTMSPDGKTIASGAWDGTVRLWDAGTSAPIATFLDRRPVQHFGALAIDSAGERIVACGSKGTLVWDTATGTLQPLNPPLTTAAFSPDGRLLVAVFGNSLEVWDAKSMTRRKDRKVVNVAPKVVFAPDGASFATVSSWPPKPSPAIVIWGTDSLEPSVVLRPPGSALAMAFSPDGSQLVSSDKAGNVMIWDAETSSEQPRLVLGGHEGEVFAVAWLNGQRIASGGRDETIRIWDAESGHTLVTLRGHTEYVWSLAVSPDGQRLVSGSGDRTVRIWETGSMAERRQSGRAVRAVRPKAEALALRLFNEEGEVKAVLARLQEQEDLNPLLRREARHAVLRESLKRRKSTKPSDGVSGR